MHLRDRRQPPLARARGRPARGVPVATSSALESRSSTVARRPRDADRPRRGVPQRRPGLVRRRTASRRRDASPTSTRPRYRNLLVVENPATSSPGLAFLLATVATFGDAAGRPTGASCARTACSPSTAGRRRTRSSSPGAAGSPGKRPIVVSYATSPAAEVIFASKPLDVAPTAAIEDGCYRQVEYAGILRGARERGRARRARSTSCSPSASRPTCPGSMFVYPVREGVAAARGVRRARDRPGGSARAARPTRSTRTATAGSPSGPRSSCAEPRATRPRPSRSRSRSSRVFFVWPLAAILERSLVVDGGARRPARRAHARRRRARSRGSRSGRRRVSTALTLVAGLPLAWALVALPFPRPLARRGARARARSSCRRSSSRRAFVALLPDGVERSVWAILLAHVFFNVAVVVRVVGGVLGGARPRGSGDAAATLGASPGAAPPASSRCRCSRPRSPRAASIVFLFCFTSFGVIVVLGGLRYATLESEIYNQAARLFDLRTAAALALLQLAAVAATVLVVGRLERAARRRAAARPPGAAPRRPPARRASHGRRRPARSPCSRSRRSRSSSARSRSATATGSTTSRRSPTRRPRCSSRRGTRSSTRCSSRPPRRRSRSRRNPRGRRRRTRPRGRSTRSLMLPLGASAAMLGFGFLLAFDDPPLDLRSSPAIVPVAQALVALPFVVRALVPALRAADVRLREAAAVLGATPVAGASRDRAAAPRAPARRRGRPRVRRRARRVRRDRLRRRARTGRPCPSRSSGSSAGPARTTSARRWRSASS